MLPEDEVLLISFEGLGHILKNYGFGVSKKLPWLGGYQVKLPLGVKRTRKDHKHLRLSRRRGMQHCKSTETTLPKLLNKPD